jgi:Restriction endonuclease
MRSGPPRKLSENAWGALTEALATFHWYKPPFETMVRSRFSDAPELLAKLNFGDPKRRVAAELVASLRANEDRYQSVVLDALLALSEVDSSFPHLARLDDCKARVSEAQRALAAVVTVTDGYSEVVAHRQRIQDEFDSRSAQDENQRSHNSALQSLLERFMAMHGAASPQQRGRDFEGFLNELFTLWDLSPRAAYSLDHEQVDGAFTFRTDDYLLEARWWNEPLQPKELNDFKAKVDSKARNTLGLCIAVGGFTPGAVANHSRGQTPLILMDGTDLVPILEGRIGLDEVLERKRRHAAETGIPMFRAMGS